MRTKGGKGRTATRMTDPIPPRQSPMLGISLRLGAAASFGLMAAAIKLGHEAGITLVELAFYRFAFGLPPLLAWMAITRNFGAWRTRRPLLHVSRGVLGLGAMLCAFSALALLPLAESATIGFVAPLFSVMLSALILREPVGHHRWSAVALGFLGVLIVMQPGGGVLPVAGLALALTATLGVAAVTITIRSMSRTESAQTIVLWFTGFSMFVIGALMPFFGEAHDGREWAILAAIGLAGGMGQLFLTSSLRAAPVSVVVPFDYTQLLWAVLIGWLLWGTHPPAATWIGAAVIVVSGLYTLYREHRLGREKPPAEPL